MNKISIKRSVIPVIFLLFFVSYLLIYTFVHNSDLGQHAGFAQQMLSGEMPVPGNFLFYWLVNLFSFFSGKAFLTKISLCFLIAIASTFRFFLSQKIVLKSFNNTFRSEHTYWVSVLIGLSLMFVFAIPLPGYFVNGFFYIGNFVPNVWHNSTTIFLFPFAIILFYLSYMQLITLSLRRNIWISILIILNVFIKPSYLFVFVCVYPFFLLYKYKLNKEFWLGIGPVLFGIFLVVLEYCMIFQNANLHNKEMSAVIFKPFVSYTYYSHLWQLPLSLIFSLLFPISYVIMRFPKLKRDLLFWFTFLSFIVALLIYFLIAESGPRATHGNFYWQIVICTWLCFFITVIALLKDIESMGLTMKNRFLLSLYSVHVLIGVVYFARLFIVKSYS
jgi:hypothetical protein